MWHVINHHLSAHLIEIPTFAMEYSDIFFISSSLCSSAKRCWKKKNSSLFNEKFLLYTVFGNYRLATCIYLTLTDGLALFFNATYKSAKTSVNDGDSSWVVRHLKWNRQNHLFWQNVQGFHLRLLFMVCRKTWILYCMLLQTQENYCTKIIIMCSSYDNININAPLTWTTPSISL